jgi:hypothetical protein
LPAVDQNGGCGVAGTQKQPRILQIFVIQRE